MRHTRHVCSASMSNSGVTPFHYPRRASSPEACGDELLVHVGDRDGRIQSVVEDVAAGLPGELVNRDRMDGPTDLWFAQPIQGSPEETDMEVNLTGGDLKIHIRCQCRVNASPGHTVYTTHTPPICTRHRMAKHSTPPGSGSSVSGGLGSVSSIL